MRISDWSSDVCSSDLSWRVSTMGLMNVGQTEGSQIIQLFGRGVRLKGYGSSLKRSGKTELPADMTRPKDLGVLETLSIFGIRADVSEDRRGGNECVSTVRVRWWPYPKTINHQSTHLIEVVFFKQKTAYEMRIRDGSSDVCSSDLAREHHGPDECRPNGGLADHPALRPRCPAQGIWLKPEAKRQNGAARRHDAAQGHRRAGDPVHLRHPGGLHGTVSRFP